MAGLTLRHRQKVPPYTALATIYDFVMNHVDYTAWAEYIHRLIRRHKVSVESVLDISCGTGSFCLSIAPKGYRISGCDVSAEMVRQAVDKARKKRQPADFWCADMSALATRRTYDCVVSLYDSMNYLMQESQWQACLEQVFRVLRPGGILVFDVSTLSNSREFFRGFVQREQNEQAHYRRKSYFDEKLNIQNNEFEIQFRQNQNTIFQEHHRQRIRSMQELDKLISGSRFEILSRYDGFTFRLGSDQSERVHYLLKKPEEGDLDKTVKPL